MKLCSDIKGQTQIVAALIIGTAMLAGGLWMLEFSGKNTERIIKSNLRIEMRSAIDAAAQVANGLYHSSGCDPVIFNNQINRMNTDGHLNGTSSSASSMVRQFTYTVNHRQYSISFGEVSTVAWSTPSNNPYSTKTAGTSQDASITLWTHYGTEKVKQTVVLMNNCTHPCVADESSTASGSYDYSGCMTAADPAIAYYSFSGLNSSVPTLIPSTGNSKCGSSNSRGLGDFNADDSNCNGTVDSILDHRERTALQNYLRSGDSAGSCKTLLAGTVGGALSATYSCADFNQDSLVTEVDLNILEKVMRGYLNSLQTKGPETDEP